MNLTYIDFSCVFQKYIDAFAYFLENHTNLEKDIFFSNTRSQFSIDCCGYCNLTSYLVYINKLLNKNNIKIFYNFPDEDKLKFNDVDNLTIISCNYNIKKLQMTINPKHCVWVQNNCIGIDSNKLNDIEIKSQVDLDLEGLVNLPDPDQLILCLNSQLIPSEYRIMFDTWVNILDNINGLDYQYEDTDEFKIYITKKILKL